MSMSEELQLRQRRAGMTQAMFRNVNEIIETQSDGATFVEFACECALKSCDAVLTLAVDEYEEVRKQPTHFIVAPGHAIAAVETVVEETPRYQVVEKRDDAAMVAARLDARRLARQAPSDREEKAARD